MAGWILRQKGYELLGIYLHISDEKGISDAQKSADFLGIPLKVLDVREAFQEKIIQPFKEKKPYKSGDRKI